MSDLPEIPLPENSAHEADGGAAAVWDDLQFGFLGNARTRLDERGRLKLPTEFKSFVDRKYGKGFSAFYINSSDGETAEVYPLPEWQQHFTALLKLPQSLTARRKLMDLHALFGGRVDMDPQGRLLLPEEFRNRNILVGDVKVSGEGKLLRVTSMERLEKRVEENPMTAAELDTLTEYGL